MDLSVWEKVSPTEWRIEPSGGMRGVAKEAPEAYKSVERVVDAAETAGLAHKVARLEPLVCIKG